MAKTDPKKLTIPRPKTRKPVPPPAKAFRDKRKEAERRESRRKVRPEKTEEEETS